MRIFTPILIIFVLFLFSLQSTMAKLITTREDAKVSILKLAREYHGATPIKICNYLDIFVFIKNTEQSISADECDLDCINSGAYDVTGTIAGYSINECLNDAKLAIDQIEKEEAKENNLAQDKEIKVQHEVGSDLKSGKKKPLNIKQVLIAYDAKDGNSLAGSPKIRPDGVLYAIYGTIVFASDDDSFAASFTDGENQFDVKIPTELKEQYLSTAQIGKDFIVVGHYNTNKEYITQSGTTKLLPSIDAVYFKMELSKAIKEQIARCWLEMSQQFRRHDSTIDITDEMIDKWESECTDEITASTE